MTRAVCSRFDASRRSFHIAVSDKSFLNVRRRVGRRARTTRVKPIDTLAHTLSLAHTHTYIDLFKLSPAHASTPHYHY